MISADYHYLVSVNRQLATAFFSQIKRGGPFLKPFRGWVWHDFIDLSQNYLTIKLFRIKVFALWRIVDIYSASNKRNLPWLCLQSASAPQVFHHEMHQIKRVWEHESMRAWTIIQVWNISNLRRIVVLSVFVYLIRNLKF